MFDGPQKFQNGGTHFSTPSFLLGCQYGKPSRNLGSISSFFNYFFSVSGKVLPVTSLLSSVFVRRVFSAYFVRFEGAGVIRRSPWCTQEKV